MNATNCFKMPDQIQQVGLSLRDGEIYTVDLPVARMFGSVSETLGRKPSGFNAGLGFTILVDANVPRRVMMRVIAWATHHQHDPPSAEYYEDDDDLDAEQARIKCAEYTISPWDVKFLNVGHSTLFRVMLAAHDLGVRGLKELTCNAAAKLFSGKSRQQYFDTVGDYLTDFGVDEGERIRSLIVPRLNAHPAVAEDGHLKDMFASLSRFSIFSNDNKKYKVLGVQDPSQDIMD